MDRIGITSLLMFLICAASQLPGAQSPIQESKVFCSSADVDALITRAKADRKEGQAIVLERVLQLPPYNANLEYRASVGGAAIHEKEAEMMFVVEGAGTIVTGGTLIGQTRPNASNLSGSGITGGTSQHLAKGDFIFVPENTAHWVSAIDGHLVLVTLHVPRPVSAP